MLNPDTRHLLTDALRPPTGWRIDAAVATTYTLDLTNLLLAPLSMAAYDHADEGIEKAAPHELLEAIRRYADRTTVFCQAGGIHVPSTYRKLIVFAEQSIVEVTPPTGRTFHPKIWVLRFVNTDGAFTHRLACLSRNMTGDRSWDTVLVTDEDAMADHQMPAAPAAQFLEALLEMSARPVPQGRVDLIRDVVQTLRGTAFAVPRPFTNGILQPLGTPGGASWPMPAEADRAVVISPFLDVSTVRRLPSQTTIVSRPEALDRVGAVALAGHQQLVLQPHADAPPDAGDGDSADETEVAGDGSSIEIKSGLHAKVLAWDVGPTGTLLTGSANATSAAFGGNIEFGVLLSGPAAQCGAAAILRDDDSATGLMRLLQPYAAIEGQPQDLEYELEREIEEFHAALAASQPEFHVEAINDGYELSLRWTDPPIPVGDSRVRPITVKPAFERALGDSRIWSGLGLSDLTPFLAVRTKLERDGVTVERCSALSTTLVGAPEDRARSVLRELLSKIEDVLRYLALLLRDPGLDDVASTILETTHDGPGVDRGGSRGWTDDLILVEPLVRAYARDDGSLERVERLLEDLRDDEGRLPDLGPDFDDLWRVVSLARGGR